MKIFTVADVPDALGNAWLQHLRDFDAANPGCHFEIIADDPKQPLAKTMELVRITPPLAMTSILALITADYGVGDQVEKHTGDYQLVGEVRGIFTTKRGKVRYAVEHDPGFLHIYSTANLRPITFNDKQKGSE